MSRIGVIFTGGTIGSRVTPEGFVAGDGDRPRKLLKLYSSVADAKNSPQSCGLHQCFETGVQSDEKLPNLEASFCEGTGIDFIVDEPYSILSENLTAREIVLLVDAVRRMLSKGVDGVIVTHGTDTLTFTAAMLDLIFGKCKVPVVLVSSDYPLEDDRANGLHNFTAAVEYVSAFPDAHGVYVSFKNCSENFVTIHCGRRLLFQEAYTADVHSIDNRYINKYLLDKKYFETYDKNNNTDDIACNYADDTSEDDYGMFKDNASAERALVLGAKKLVWLRCHPQMVYPAVSDGMSVLIETYHSGTMYVGERFQVFADEMQSHGGTIYITGVDAGRNQYETTKGYDRSPVVILPKMSPVTAYCMIWLKCAEKMLGKGERDVFE